MWIYQPPRLTCSASARHGKVVLGPNRVIAKDVKSCTYCCYVKCTTLIIRVEGMSWPQTDATHYQAKLGLPEKDRAIKWLVVGYVLWLGSLKLFGLGTGARYVGFVLCFGQAGYQAQVPQHPIYTYLHAYKSIQINSYTSRNFKNIFSHAFIYF